MPRGRHALDATQLDIFEHSRDLMLRNDVPHALERRDPTASRAACLKLQAEYPDDHALQPLQLLVATLERADGEPFADAAEAVQRITSWRRIPAPLAWMIEARFDVLTRRLADPVLTRLRRHFDAGFEGEGTVADLARFPACALRETPAPARALGQTQAGPHSPPERALRQLRDLQPVRMRPT